jgi:hypothetical protein
VKLNGKTVLLAMLLALASLGGAGCSGINASQSVSPLDFLLPGAGGFLPGLLRNDATCTNTPPAVTSVQIASVK